jgi:hypothetical protein
MEFIDWLRGGERQQFYLTFMFRLYGKSGSGR